MKYNNKISSLQNLLALITAKTSYEPKIYGSGYKMRCTAHEDKNPSLSVGQGSDGKLLLHCFSGCTLQEVCISLDLNVSDLFPDSSWR